MGNSVYCFCQHVAGSGGGEPSAEALDSNRGSDPSPALPAQSATDGQSKQITQDAFGSEQIMEAEEDKKRLSMIVGQGRRAGVAAEHVSIADIKDWKKPVYPKDAASHQRIKDIVKSNEKLQVIFGHLDGAALDDVANAFQAITMHQGKDIIRQGEEGDSLYIINNGEVDVFVARPGPGGKLPSGDRGPKVVSLGAGALFGELALLYNAPRAASVVTKGECVCWQLDRDSFSNIVKEAAVKHRNKCDSFLKSVALLSSIDAYERSQIADALKSETFQKGDAIIRQDEPGDKFYILEEGTLYAQKNVGQQEVKRVMDYKAGDYFGELALLKNQPRAATVIVEGENAKVLSMSRQAFSKMLGPLQAILARQVSSYQ